VLRRYGHLDAIPEAPGQWDVPGLRGAAKLATTLRGGMADALLFRRLATLDAKGPDVGEVDAWRWAGPPEGVEAAAELVAADALLVRARRLAATRSSVPGG
jgi:hypothetical protein